MLESAQTGVANKKENMPQLLYVTRKFLHTPEVLFQEFWEEKKPYIAKLRWNTFHTFTCHVINLLVGPNASPCSSNAERIVMKFCPSPPRSPSHVAALMPFQRSCDNTPRLPSLSNNGSERSCGTGNKPAKTEIIHCHVS